MTFTLSPEDVKRCREINIGKHDLIMDIVRAVCEQVGIPVKAILSDARTRPLSHARWLICYIAHVEQGHGVEAIARVIRKDHSSVVYGVKMERERRALVGKLSVGDAP
jgi:chromosomal replication initiation ATPase DnaA